MAYDLVKDAANRRDDARAREQTLANEVAKLRNEYQQKQMAVSNDYASKRSRVQTDLDTVVRNITSQTRDISELQSQQTKLQKKMQELQSELNELQSAQTGIQNRLSEQQGKQSDYTKKLQGIQTDQMKAERLLDADYRTRIDRLESERRVISSRLPTLENDYKNAVAKQKVPANSNLKPETRGYGNLNRR